MKAAAVSLTVQDLFVLQRHDRDTSIPRDEQTHHRNFFQTEV